MNLLRIAAKYRNKEIYQRENIQEKLKNMEKSLRNQQTKQS